MTARPTADIVADLRTPPVAMNWWKIMLEAADCLTELNTQNERLRVAILNVDARATRAVLELGTITNALPPCPTCGGKHTLDSHDKDQGRGEVLVTTRVCPDCPPDGKVPIERLVRVFEAVWDDTNRLFYPNEVIDVLRGIR